jgi:pimeloyl-ACP methyl ester carboxylesterase
MPLSLSSSSVVDGVRERAFRVGDVPGTLWDAEPGEAPVPLILLAHGGGQHKAAPGIVARARRFVTELGAAAVAIDAPGHGDRPQDPVLAAQAAELRARMAAGEPVATLLTATNQRGQVAAAEWRALLDALVEAGIGTGPVGFWGVSMGCATGIPLVAADSRITAAVFGLAGADGLAAAAARITVPVEFALQWDDEFIPRDSALALFDAFGSAEKTLHANSGGHLALPRFEIESAVRFFARHLG